MTTIEALAAGAIRAHNTDTSDGEWDADANRAHLPSESSALRDAHAWVDADGDTDAKSRHRLLHHEVAADGTVGPANMAACLAGIHALNRADSVVPEADRAGAYAHLRNHLRSGGRPEATIPELRGKAEASAEGAVTAAADDADGPESEAEPEMAESGAPMADADGIVYRRWRALAVLEGVWTGDDRMMEPGSLTWRELPQSLMAQMETAPEHERAAAGVGRIDSAERVDASKMIDARTGKPCGDGAQAIMMHGVFDNDELARHVAEKVRSGFLRGVSVDLSDVDYVDELVDADGNAVSVDGDDVDLEDVRLRTRVTSGRIMGLTITAFPAFECAYIELLDDEGNEGPATEPGRPTREQQAAAVRASSKFTPRRCLPCEAGAMVAAAAPVEPPAEWFADPELTGPTGITITDEGRVFGHVADWDTCHTGYTGQCVKPPRSATNYAVFRTGAVKCADGSVIPTGTITVDAGHADTRRGVTARDAMAHYDNIATAVADVATGEDAYGIWFAGALRPDATPEQVRALRASRLSGDWRPWGGNRELIAAHAVNTPGFPVLRQITASGEFVALIATGPPPATATPAELDEVRRLLPVLTAAAARELATQEAEGRRVREAAAERAAGLRRAMAAAELRAKAGVT